VEDILSSTKKLRVLGTAFTVIPLTSGRYLVQSVPGELSQDQVRSPVLRIHGILVWIRIWIWIRGSMPLINGSGCGSGSCYFPPSRCQQKTNFFVKNFFCLLLFEGSFTSFSKIKSKRSHKAVGIKFFLIIFAW
jgi:hypothetical protein